MSAAAAVEAEAVLELASNGDDDDARDGVHDAAVAAAAAVAVAVVE